MLWFFGFILLYIVILYKLYSKRKIYIGAENQNIMHRRKIQLIAGTTYTISLPKEWIKKNNLREKNEIILSEKIDNTLILSPQIPKEKEFKSVVLNIEEHKNNMEQILFSVYYLGAEDIELISKEPITKEIKAKIRKTITNMSGTEIVYEDKQRIRIKVLLDKEKINIIQTLYRIILLIDLSITNLAENMDINEIRINENEIDRLYHLITKIITISLVEPKILYSSKIKNVLKIPSYLMISKRLENIGDNINHLSYYLGKNKKRFKNKNEILRYFKLKLNKIIKYILGDEEKVSAKLNNDDFVFVDTMILEIEDKTILNYLEEILWFISSIEEEIINLSFYNQLIKKETI